MGDRVNVSHRSCPNGTWEVASWRSRRSGRTPGIRKYRGFRLALAQPRRHLMVADRVTVIVGMDGLVRISKPTTGKENAQANGSTLVAGPHSHVVVAEYDRQLFGISVVLEPWAAFALFGVPMYQLANSVLTIREVLGSEADDLALQLGIASSWTERFRLLECLFARRFEAGWTYSPLIARAWEELSRTSGAIPIEKLASVVGVSRRNLERGFREQIGLTPKALARMLRLRHVCRLLSRGIPSAEVALVCHYHDQAHLAHDFKRLMGHPPGEFLARYSPGSGEGAQPPPILAGLIT
jgi:AraC-like DNA-binding protein